MSRTDRKYLSTDIILKLTDNGRDIWSKEIPVFTTTKNIISPLRHEKNPSFRIFQSPKSGMYIGIDYTTGISYTPFTFIMSLYGLSFKQTIEKITKDITSNNNVILQKNIISKSKQLISKKKQLFEFEQRDFTENDIKYWLNGIISESFLNKHGVFSCKNISIDKKVRHTQNNEYCFVYVPNDLKYGNLKILTMGDNIEKKDKWRSNIKNSYFFYEHLIDSNDKYCFISKSNKDALVNLNIGYKSIAVISENAKNFINNYEQLQKRHPHIKFILNWGIDEDALNKISIIKKETCIDVFPLAPKYNNTDINDNFEYVKSFGYDKYELLIRHYLKTLKL